MDKQNYKKVRKCLLRLAEKKEKNRPNEPYSIIISLAQENVLRRISQEIEGKIHPREWLLHLAHEKEKTRPCYNTADIITSLTEEAMIRKIAQMIE